MADSIGVADAEKGVFYFPVGVSPCGRGDVFDYPGRWHIRQ